MDGDGQIRSVNQATMNRSPARGRFSRLSLTGRPRPRTRASLPPPPQRARGELHSSPRTPSGSEQPARAVRRHSWLNPAQPSATPTERPRKISVSIPVTGHHEAAERPRSRANSGLVFLLCGGGGGGGASPRLARPPFLPRGEIARFSLLFFGL